MELAKMSSTCSICGERSEHTVVLSWNTFGFSPGPELDTRSFAPWRYSAQRCTSCGYCGGDLARSAPGAADVVASRVYRDQLQSPAYPELANTFLCWAMAAEWESDYAAAGWASLRAAWVCDDEDHDLLGPAYVVQLTLAMMLRWATLGRVNVGRSIRGRRNTRAHATAQACRRRAAGLFRRATDSGQRLSQEAGVECVVVVDVLRRSGDLREALRRCQSDLAKRPELIVRRILGYELALIEKGDTDRHWVSQVPHWDLLNRLDRGHRGLR